MKLTYTFVCNNLVQCNISFCFKEQKKIYIINWFSFFMVKIRLDCAFSIEGSKFCTSLSFVLNVN